MIRVAYLTGAAWRGTPIPKGELPEPEQADAALLIAAGADRGIAFEVVRWDDPAAASYPAALIRSCWDYPERKAEFCATLERLEAAGVRLFNPAGVVAWNARKTYLTDLASRGVPTIPTLWAERADARFVARAFDTLDAAELVLKPQVGAGSRATIRLRRNAWAEADLALGPEGPVMAQAYLPSITEAGEQSLFYFGGRFSHAIRKVPPAGSWFANSREAAFSVFTPSDEAVGVAEAALAAMPPGALYARADLVEGADGRLRLIELEAIEPALFLTYAPTGAGALAAALSGVLSL